MAKEPPAAAAELPKFPRLQKGQRIQKRPLLHPPIAAPRTNSATPKVVYVSASSPFISVVKRVRNLLSHIEKRALGPVDIHGINDRELLAKLAKSRTERSSAAAEEVIMKATGKAVEKLLQLAIWFQEQEDLKVVVRTGSVGAVDDVVNDGEEGESRVRRTSSLEVRVSFR